MATSAPKRAWTQPYLSEMTHLKSTESDIQNPLCTLLHSSTWHQISSSCFSKWKNAQYLMTVIWMLTWVQTPYRPDAENKRHHSSWLARCIPAVTCRKLWSSQCQSGLTSAPVLSKERLPSTERICSKGGESAAARASPSISRETSACMLKEEELSLCQPLSTLC